ncbi:MAG TPA: glycosyltransferase family 2 protein [Sedimenticola sp.]|nr:glycosyltransferase family 2 protein [Sedimenticola sp.]
MADTASFLPVSVIMPVYNAAATLQRAVASVFAQTRPPAEIILIDDGSSDGSWDVMRRLADEPGRPPVRLLRLDRNAGAAEARNAGWALASQEYVAFIDADDAWHPRKLEIQQGWLAAHPEVALCGHRVEVCREPPPATVLSEAVPVQMFDLRDFLIANRLSTPAVMLRRDLHERFASDKRYSEDYLLWMQIVAAHGPAGFIDLPLAFLFKARYGEEGLSGQLWNMQLGEIDTFSRLRRQSCIGLVTWLAVVVCSWFKFARRFVLRGMLEKR